MIDFWTYLTIAPFILLALGLAGVWYSRWL
jgi:hypothetical protein